MSFFYYCHHVYLGNGGVSIESRTNFRARNGAPRSGPASQLAINHVDKKVGQIFYAQTKNGNATAEQAPSPLISHEACRRYLGNLIDGKIERITSRRYIFHRNDVTFNDKYPVVLVDEVIISGISYQNNSVFVYHCIFDTKNREVLMKWSGVRSFSGGPVALPGGNIATGPYRYGTGRGPVLRLTQDDGRLCKFRSQDGTVEVFNARSQLEITPDMTSTFDCAKGPKDYANGGYGPMADTFYNSLRSAEMFRDPDWGGLEKIVSTANLKVYAHYGKNLDDAFFRSDTKLLYVGDGNVKYYPLGTCLDLIAHEIAHSITDMYSNLIYINESGCLGESFSDMMAEMAKAYETGENDFRIGSRCMKNGRVSRDMSKPVRYSDYFPRCSDGTPNCQESHKCAAIPNYIFYKLATSYGWSTKMAGQAFLLANKIAWDRKTTIRQAGCDMIQIVRATSLAGGNTPAVINAWASAGIDLSDCSYINGTLVTRKLPSADPVTAPTTSRPPTLARLNKIVHADVYGDVRNVVNIERSELVKSANAGHASTSYQLPSAIRIANCSPKMGLSIGASSQILFVIGIPRTAKKFTIKCSATTGDPDLYFSYSTPPSTQIYDHRSYHAYRNETINGVVSQSGVDGYILAHNDGLRALGFWVYACFF